MLTHRSFRRSLTASCAALTIACTGLLTSCSTPSGSATGSPSAASGSPSGSRSGSDASAGTNPVRISGASFPLTVTDFNNQKLVFAHAPRRVCVISATPLNLWFDVDGKAVCRSDITQNLRIVPAHEKEMKAVPTVGGALSPNMEALTSYKPDLVIIMSGEQDTLYNRLHELGLRTMTVKARSMDELSATYRAFGALTGHPEIAEQRISHIRTQVNRVVAKLPNRTTKVAIVYVTATALSVKLDNSIAGQMAQTLKLRNLASGLTPDNPGSETTPLDIEEIVRQKPDYILVTSMMKSNSLAKQRINQEFATNKAWQAVDAVRNGKVIYLPQQYFLMNAGPYYGDAMEFLAASIYPDVYGAPKQVA